MNDQVGLTNYVALGGVVTINRIILPVVLSVKDPLELPLLDRLRHSRPCSHGHNRLHR
jgi:hypothetical protein